MRKLAMTLAVVSTALLAAPSANAAARWSCDGADYVCGSANAAGTKKASYEDADEGSSKRAHRVARAHKPVDSVSVASDDDKPVRHGRARHQEVASTSNDDDKPARHTRRSRSSEGGGDSFSGKASYYWEPQALASGGRFNPNAYTAAHKTLAFGTRVRVTNHNNGQSVDVIINDRGPYVAGRVIDLSKAAAQSINMTGSGVVPVSVTVLGRG